MSGETERTTIQTWEKCHAAGMTSTEAAEARGMSRNAASMWASRRGVSWARRPSRRVTDETWAACHAAGMTAREASKKNAIDHSAAYRWALRVGAQWATGADKRAAERARVAAEKAEARRELALEAAKRAEEERKARAEADARQQAEDAIEEQILLLIDRGYTRKGAILELVAASQAFPGKEAPHAS